jgi:hypothetical protein
VPRYIGPRKYEPLTRYLAALDTDEVTLTFAAIEQLVGAPLPPSAWRSSYWTRAPQPQGPQSRPWSRVGWRVARIHLRLDRPAVTFVRVTMPPRAAAR